MGMRCTGGDEDAAEALFGRRRVEGGTGAAVWREPPDGPQQGRVGPAGLERGGRGGALLAAASGWRTSWTRTTRRASASSARRCRGRACRPRRSCTNGKVERRSAMCGRTSSTAESRRRLGSGQAGAAPAGVRRQCPSARHDRRTSAGPRAAKPRRPRSSPPATPLGPRRPPASPARRASRRNSARPLAQQFVRRRVAGLRTRQARQAPRRRRHRPLDVQPPLR